MQNRPVKMLNLNFDNQENTKLDRDKIGYKKKLSKFISESRKQAKQDTCYYCNQQVSSFCNSHFVPAFCLRNIAVNGEVNYTNTLINFPILDVDKGVNEAGTFHLICRDCDSKIFKDYEDPSNYENRPSPKMIAQIAMKNFMKSISKRLIEIAMYENMNKFLPHESDRFNHQQLINKLDLIEYQKGYDKAKKLSLKNWDNEYYMFYYRKLDYVVPIAFQDGISLIADLEGNIINDIYNFSSDYHTADVHICIFPLKEYSVVFMFIDSKDKRYKSFYKQFAKLEDEDKLSLTNYMIFSYSEEVFFSKKIPNEILKNKQLVDVTKKTSIAISNNPFNNPIEEAKQNFDLTKWREIPNLLSQEYAINTPKVV